jgi:hypothetical protein
VRATDYIHHKIFRPLDSQYYKTALDLAASVHPFNKCVVFSDDIEYAKNLLKGISGLEFIYPELTPESTFTNMLYADVLITANSSFSTLAGFLSILLRKSSFIISPAQWGFSNRYPNPLYSSHIASDINFL